MGFKTVTVTPTLSTDAYADNDVLFNPVKVPDAVPFNGGSKLISVSIQGGTPTYAADSMTITLGFEM